MNLLSKLYDVFLWFFGFIPGEKITFMLRRQKERLGKAWWVMVITSAIAGNGLLLWLILHILGIW